MFFFDMQTRLTACLLGLYDVKRAERYLVERRLKRAYLAAKKTGSDSLWRTPHSSGAQENTAAWQDVANNARDLARNNPYIVGAKRRFKANLICEGVWPRPKIRVEGAKSRLDLNKALNQEILDRWELWSPSASANGDSIYQLQRVVAGHIFDDGQVLIRRIFSRKWPYMQVEALEADYLDTSKDTISYRYNAGEKRICGGIELDGHNKPIAYWLKQCHPAEGTSDSVRVPASDIIHVFDRQRASDVTGICGYASVVKDVFRLNEYAYSTMDAARLGNHFAVWIESPYINDFGEVISQPQTGSAGDAQSRRYKYITPAGVMYGLPGEKPHIMKPEQPSSQYDSFIRKSLQAVSVGAGVGYESVSQDGSQANFASSRAMLLIERAFTKMMQSVLEEQMHSGIYRWFIESEMDFGKPPLRLPGYESLPQKYLRVRFSRPVQEWVDPWKDVAARVSRINANLSTETDEAEDQGQDIEEIYATKAYEAELKKKLGLTLVEPSSQFPRPNEIQEEGGETEDASSKK